MLSYRLNVYPVEIPVLGEPLENIRLRAVLMTAFTTIVGLIPLLLATGIGSEVQRPLAIVVVFGLISSTFLTLFLIPAMYSWFENKDKIKNEQAKYYEALGETT